MRFKVRFHSILIPILLAGCCIQAQEPLKSNPTAICSLALEPLMLLCVEELRSTNPQFKLDVRPNVATEVAKALIEGRSQLAPITREFKPEELASFTAKWGYAPTRVAIGMDALVILVQRNNPIKEIKIEQLDAAWTTTRKNGWPKDVATWGDLGVSNGNWALRPIICIDRPEGSGLREFFKQTVTLGGKHKDTNRPSTDSATLVEEIASNQAAIGYGSLSEVFNITRAVGVIPVGGKLTIDPTRENVANGTYPLARVIYIYFNRTPGRPILPPVLEFMRFMLSPRGQRQMELAGLVSLPQDLMEMNTRRLAN
jgi:phosphate transport system substrate-binding protein